MAEDAEGFWTTDYGLRLRLQDLSQFIVTRSYNNALQAFAPEFGVQRFRFTTMRDGRVCSSCFSLDSKVYRAGMFMPYLPRHINCRCYFDVYMETG